MTDDDFVSFDFATDRRDELVDLLWAWTDVARRMAEGRDADGNDRFGLARQFPEALRPLPHFPGDDLDPDRSGGTSPSRRAPTTRRSPSTPSATWPVPPSGWPPLAGPSSASAALRRPAARRPRRAT